jgi:hypothetical protein
MTLDGLLPLHRDILDDRRAVEHRRSLLSVELVRGVARVRDTKDEVEFAPGCP